MQLRALLRDVVFSFSSNALQLMTSAIIILILPKFITGLNYGLFQVFLFYISYVGLSTFGWLDGIFLEFGGSNTAEIMASHVGKQLRIFVIYLVAISTILTLGIAAFTHGDIRLVYQLVVIGGVIYNINLFMGYILQATRQFAKYAISQALINAIYVILILVSVNQQLGYIGLAMTYIISQFFGMVVLLSYSSEWAFNKYDYDLRGTLIDTNKYIRRGIKMLIANYSGLLIIGIVRYFIQAEWSVQFFGKISMLFSLVNFILVFVSSFATVLFPHLRNVDENDLLNVKVKMDRFLAPILILVLILVFPMKGVLKYWLPKYEASLYLLDLIFPVIVFQSIFQLSQSTILKTKNREDDLLISNVVGFVLNGILAAIAIYIFHSISLALMFTLLSFMVRNMVANYLMNQHVFNNSESLGRPYLYLYVAVSWLVVSQEIIGMSAVYSLTGILLLLLVSVSKIKSGRGFQN